MKTSIFKLFVKRFLFALALAVGAAFHVTPAIAQHLIDRCMPITENGQYFS